MSGEETVRKAMCWCGQLSAECRGEPVRISVCHCLNCKRRTGGVFGAQARWPEAQVTVTGERKTWAHKNESGSTLTTHFCPQCGAMIAYKLDVQPGFVAVPVGAFADPDFPPPRFSMYENRKCDWVAILGEDVEHD